MLKAKKPVAPPAKPVSRAPYPASNLGAHLKAPKSGEIVTSHHRTARRDSQKA